MSDSPIRYSMAVYYLDLLNDFSAETLSDIQ